MVLKDYRLDKIAFLFDEIAFFLDNIAVLFKEVVFFIRQFFFIKRDCFLSVQNSSISDIVFLSVGGSVGAN